MPSRSNISRPPGGAEALSIKVTTRLVVSIGFVVQPSDQSATSTPFTASRNAGDKLDAKGAKAFGPGSYFSIEQGKPMFAYTTDKETTLQLHGNGPWGITYMDAKDAAKKK